MIDNMITAVIEKYGEVEGVVLMESISELNALVDEIDSLDLDVSMQTNPEYPFKEVSFNDVKRHMCSKSEGISAKIESDTFCITLTKPYKYLNEIEIMEMALD